MDRRAFLAGLLASTAAPAVPPAAPIAAPVGKVTMRALRQGTAPAFMLHDYQRAMVDAIERGRGVMLLKGRNMGKSAYLQYVEDFHL